MAFSNLKAHLRRIGARTFTDMFQALTEICDLFLPEECWNDLSVTSRELVWDFLEQLRFEFVPVFHGLQGRPAAEHRLG